MTTQHDHSVGDKPTNPIITDKWVYIIANVEQETPPEDDGLDHWSYDVIDKIDIAEYTKSLASITDVELAEARSLTNAYELYLELLGGE